MVSIANTGLLPDVEIGEPLDYRSLRVVPLVGPSRVDPSYRLFGPETAGDVEVDEVSDAGSVPNLGVRNRLTDRILLVDGQELIGAKQNRILNADVLVPASKKITIPVSCVEAGRWAYTRRGFSAGKMAYRSARAAKCVQVHRSLQRDAAHRSDQGEVWAGIDKVIRCLDASSPSSAMSDAYMHKEEELAEAREAFSLPDDTLGVAVYLNDRLVGLDLFDRAATLKHHWQSLLDSYVLDWLAFGGKPAETGEAEQTESATPLEELFENLQQAEWERFDAPGEGDDLRHETDRITASALAWGEGDARTIVHLQAFPK